MPKGTKGEKRPADVIGNAVHVMRIATGEIEEDRAAQDTAAQELGRNAATPAVPACLESAEIAKDTAKSRWQNR